VSVSPDPAGARLISSLSHELKTPLSVVVGYAELLERRSDEAVRLEASKRIREAAERLSYSLDDLLIVFAIDAGYLVLDIGPLDLEPAVREAVRLFESRGSGCSVSTRAPGGVWPSVRADEEQLVRVLTDLIRNASTGASDDCEIEIAASADADSASISVSDNGSGLTAEQLAAAFERLPAGHPGPGQTGLELYKVRRLIELQGGTISVTSRPGEGSTFTFILPLAGESVE
jgi:signal transduction histidine kinase